MKEGITRSRHNRIFGGVAAGLAEYLDIDPIIVRILFVVSIFFSGIGILIYLIMWVVVPEENLTQTTFNSGIKKEQADYNDVNFVLNEQENKRGKIAFGTILLLLGIFFLGVKIFSFINFEDLFPLLLIGFGIYIIAKSKKGSELK